MGQNRDPRLQSLFPSRPSHSGVTLAESTRRLKGLCGAELFELARKGVTGTSGCRGSGSTSATCQWPGSQKPKASIWMWPFESHSPVSQGAPAAGPLIYMGLGRTAPGFECDSGTLGWATGIYQPGVRSPDLLAWACGLLQTGVPSLEKSPHS